MEFQDELLTVAELAVGIAGFSAVVAAFAHRGGLQDRDVVRFRNLVTSAGAAVILAFCPSLLAGIGLTGSDLWRAASGLMVVAGLGGMIPFIVKIIGDRRAPGSSLTISTGVAVAIVVPSFAVITLQIVNTSGVFWAPNGAPYLFGVLVWLWSAGVVFMDIVVNRSPAN